MTNLSDYSDLLERLDPVLNLARTAGEAILRHYGTYEVEVRSKADASPLTEADLASHAVIVGGLAAIDPSIPIISEEGADHRAAAREGLWWLVDPLDGTKEFLSRNGEFTVNVALMRGTSPLWGVVHAPAIDQSFWGGRACAASWCCRGGPTTSIHCAPPPTAQGPWRVLASKSHLNEATSSFIDSLQGVSLIQAGSSLKFCRVADGSADVYPRLAPTCEWDTAAAQAVLEGAGGGVFTLDMRSLDYGRNSLLNPSFVAVGASTVPGSLTGAFAAAHAGGN